MREQAFKSNLIVPTKKSRRSSKKLDTLFGSFIKFYQNKGLNFQKFSKGWLILCPFHDDRNPSLGVYRDGTTFCYACMKVYKLEDVFRAYGFLG